MRSQADATPAFLYLPDLGEPGASIALSREESHYVSRVCRAQAGDRVTAVDGRGGAADLRLTSVGSSVEGLVERRETRDRSRRVWVWCGAPEGERADWLIEKLAELGAEAWQPVECRRGSWERAASRLERWRRLAIAAMRQSRRAHLMEIRTPISLDRALGAIPEESDRWLASPTGERPPGPVDPRLQVGAIGPSAGFTDEEEASLRSSGFRPICLAEGRLRTETAALAWTVWTML